MRKIISVTLVIIFALMVWSVLVFGKAKKEETSQPTQIQKTEPNSASEAFPKMVLPKAHPRRPTMEDFEREVLKPRGITPEMLESVRTEVVPAKLEPEKKETLYCRVRNQHMFVDHFPLEVVWLSCWDQVGIATYLDLDNNWYYCPNPLYPFQVDKVQMSLYAPDTCTFIVESRIYSADYSGGGPYPDSLLCSSDSLNPTVFHHTGGYNNISVNLQGTCCVNEPFYGVFVIDNTDDFDTLNSPHCPSALYKFWPGWRIDDLSYGSWGRYQSYWNPNGLNGFWYDVMEYEITFGTIRVEAYGYTKEENTCPNPPETWYFKEAYPPYAPCGIPDFDQLQVLNAYCGPTAGANLIWWYSAKGDILLPLDVPALINELATEAHTDTLAGTECDSLGKAILKVIKNYGGWWFRETTRNKPDFWFLQYMFRDIYKNPFWLDTAGMRENIDIVLLLGFWQQQPDSTWRRFGGHFVTLSGIDIFNYAFAISDPALDAGETGMVPGKVCGTHSPANDPTDHNSGITSYDYYSVAWPSASPGGSVWLPDYEVDWEDFQDRNFSPEHQVYHGTYDSLLPVAVEAEQAIIVGHGVKEMGGEVHGSSSDEINNNHGGIDGFCVQPGFNVLYKGSLAVGQTQSNLNCDYGGYYWDRTFDPSAPPVLDTFTIPGSAGDYSIQQLTNKFAHRFIPGLDITMYAFGIQVPTGGGEDCKYVMEDVYVIENTSLSDIPGLENGMLFDYDIGNTCLVDFDQIHQSMWIWDNAGPSTVIGLTEVPATVGTKMVTGWGLSNPARIYDGQYMDSLKYWMESLGWGVDNPTTAEDKSLLMSDSAFTLPASGIHLSKWFKWGYNSSIASGGDANWRHFLYRVLHQFGYYRGDVNQDGNEDVADVIYKVNYLFRFGPQPIEFVDQGDVNGDGKMTVSDVVYEVNYLFRGGPAAIDKNRFFAGSPFVDSTYKALGIRNPGLFGEPDWKDLGK